MVLQGRRWANGRDGGVGHLCPYQQWTLGTVSISSPLQPWHELPEWCQGHGAMFSNPQAERPLWDGAHSPDTTGLLAASTLIAGRVAAM